MIGPEGHTKGHVEELLANTAATAATAAAA